MTGDDAVVEARSGLVGDPRVAAFRQATESLITPGQPFEVVEDDVLGERMLVFRNRPRSLRQVLVEAKRFGDRDCYVFDDGRRYRFDTLEAEVAAVAVGLQREHGVGPGDRVAICAANCPEWILTFWAAASLGAVVVAMNGWWTETETRHALDLSEPTLVLTDEKRRARLGDDPGLTTLIIERDFAGLQQAGAGASLPDTPIAEDDPFILMFTSGTTGRPKAAVLSHRNVIGFLTCQGFISARGMTMAGRPEAIDAPPGTRLAVFPLFHVSGMGAAVSGPLGGGTTVWPLGRFDPGHVIELTRAEGIGSWGGTSTHVLRLLEHPDVETLDPMMITQVGIGGSASTPDIIRRTEERFPHLVGTFSSGYGSTETGGIATWAPNWMLTVSADCVGPALPTIDVAITDDADEFVTEGVEGNIVVRSPLVMFGYWRHEQANAETFLPGRWVKTGDFGRIEDGLLFIASRKRDLILRGGENIYPFEVENRLDEHPDIVEAAVFGVDHPVYGQEVKAVIVVRDGAQLTVAEVQRFCAEQLASYKVPAHVEIRDEPFPRNATGKVMKHVLAGQATNTFVED